ncbi:C-C motif chemokine 26 [Pteropus medius]|uniref:C-C motif chemokine 26 n=1 Tax=Pteropus vampyrus TaxID=132908 RepID=A0A6P3QVM9_PTEVA|nr:C-C motif chemokine 26 [Pteropus vampyrus]XP_039705141.1 C-C motif chemokine 26 [Pteropus giganteus]
MKSFPMAPPLLLVFILSIHLEAATRGSNVAKFCCSQFSHRTLPWQWVQTYEFTRNSCSQQAVIFTTKRGRKVCAQPKAKWVQSYISLLRARQ